MTPLCSCAEKGNRGRERRSRERESESDIDAFDSEAARPVELCEWNIRAADMSLPLDCQNKTSAPTGEMSAKKQRSRKRLEPSM